VAATCISSKRLFSTAGGVVSASWSALSANKVDIFLKKEEDETKMNLRTSHQY
jgi:hypothetical protein